MTAPAEIKARGDAAAAQYPVGTRVQLTGYSANHRQFGWDLVGTVVSVTRSWKYGHAYIWVQWRRGSPSSYRYLDGNDLAVVP